MILVLGRARFARLISPDTEVIALAAACISGKILWIYLIQGLGYLGLSLAYTWKKSKGVRS